MKKNILVTGSHRSGTTWVGKILASDRNVSYLHEPFKLEPDGNYFGLPLRYWFTYIPDVAEQDLLFEKLDRILSLQWRKMPRDTGNWSKRLGENIQHAARSCLNSWLVDTVVIKDPIALFSAEQLARRYNMDVVCMIRHPLAFCSSIKNWHWGFPFNHFLKQPQLMDRFFGEYQREIEVFAKDRQPLIEQAILLWNLLHAVIRQYREQNEDWIFLRHEDVVKSPAEVFQGVFSKLNLDFSKTVRTNIELSLSSAEGEPKGASFKSRNQNAVLESWKKRLSEEEIELVNRKTRAMRLYFYPEEGESELP